MKVKAVLTFEAEDFDVFDDLEFYLQGFSIFCNCELLDCNVIKLEEDDEK